jgi:hypothetical protein
MKAMQRDPHATDKARRAERRADEKGGGLISIRPVKLEGGGGSGSGSGGGGVGAGGGAVPAAAPVAKGGFKKGGFKSAFGGEARDERVGGGALVRSRGAAESGTGVKALGQEDEDGEEELGYECYDPRRPTGCTGGCGVR